MLPIHEALPALKATLGVGNAAVLVAPPGAGKTTVVPLELLGERNERVDELTQDLVEAKTIYRSQILMLCPRLA